VWILGTAAFALSGDVVVLKGGAVVELQQPLVRRGNTAYLTRADGTLLSVPVSEIDKDATAAARAAAAAPKAPAIAAAPDASTPAEVVRTRQDVPKARVRITDDDVSHPLEDPVPAAPGDKKEQTAGGPRVEIADYTQEKNGATLVVKGSLRNPGQGPAENVRMSVTAIDEKGQSIDGTTAVLSKGILEAGQSVDFTASMNVGERTVATVRFAPQWSAPKLPPPPTPRPGTAAAAEAARAASPAPASAPTPYGRGNIWAAPVANAPSQAPADGKTGYIPGATSPDNQPKPPSR
jgi:hypothetical protein